MKCKNCGAEMPDNQKFCSDCGAQLETVEIPAQAVETPEEIVETPAQTEETPVETEEIPAQTEETPAQAVETPVETEETPAQAVETPAQTEETPAQTVETPAQAVETPATAAAPIPQAPIQAAPKKKNDKIVIGVIAAVAVAVIAVIAAGAFAVVKLTAKNPKQTVIDAFASIYPENQVSPIDELLGISKFAETMGTVDSQLEMTVRLDSCSDSTFNDLAGSGVRISSKNDIKNEKASAEIAAIYNGMDFAKMEFYYGEETLKAALPELSKKVFVMDLGDGLADRLSESPVLGPALEEQGIDVESFAEGYTQLMEEAKERQASGTKNNDLENLLKRYREGSKAQENFKAALTVEKGEKATFTVNGKEVSCKGYEVTVSKESMMDFLRTSSDFFLEDEELKDQYLKQLETTVRMSELMNGSSSYTPSAREMQKQTYAQVSQSVDDMLDVLDDFLDDVEMTVYVDKKGRLAALDGSTTLHNPKDADDTIAAAFHLEFAGGAYPTQNVTGNVSLTAEDDKNGEISVDFLKTGTYDGKKLTSDWSIDMEVLPEDTTYNLTYTGTYDSDGGDFHAELEAGYDSESMVKISAKGAVDKLEKGTSIHAELDSLKIHLSDGVYSFSLALSGEYEYKPLSDEITEPDGKELDILEATQEDWMNVILEIIYSISDLEEEFDISLF